MFELVENILKVDKPKFLSVYVMDTYSKPEIIGGTTIVSNQAIIDQIPSWEWQGVCTSNGGNFDYDEGNIIEILFKDDDVALVIATDSVTGEEEIYLLNVPEESDTEHSDALLTGNRLAPVSFKVGSEKVSKKYFNARS